MRTSSKLYIVSAAFFVTFWVLLAHAFLGDIVTGFTLGAMGAFFLLALGASFAEDKNDKKMNREAEK